MMLTFALKLREINDLIVYTPEVDSINYESISRGVENNTEKQIRFHKEVAYMNYRWAKYYVEGDPYITQISAWENPEIATIIYKVLA